MTLIISLASPNRLADPSVPFDQKLNPSPRVYYDGERACYQSAVG